MLKGQGQGLMKKKLALLAVIIFVSSLVVISTKYFSTANKKGTIPYQASVSGPDKMEGVSIKKQFRNTTLIIDASILKPHIQMPLSFLQMVTGNDDKYSLRLRNVKIHLIEHAKDLLIEGTEALSNAEFTSLKIKLHSVLSNNGYTINPNAECVVIKISGNKVKVFS
jgi:hypothetical protein